MAFLWSILLLAVAPAASAASGLIVSPPILQRDASEVALYVGGISEDGTTLKPSAIAVELDGRPAPWASVNEVFSDFARGAVAERPRWRSPLAVGLVYLWVKDIPPGIADAILEGIDGFCRRIPGRTHVYATLYGRKRQPIPRLKASELAAQLHDIGFLGGDRPNLGAAIRLDLKALRADDSPFKVMLVVTDGRDHDDETGDGRADFLAVAEAVRDAGAQLMVVSFPTNDADAEQSAKNLLALGSSGAIERAVERPLGMQVSVEALGQAIADLRRVRVAIPWTWRTFGGSRRIRVTVTSEGRERVIEAGTVSVAAAAKAWLWPLGSSLALLGLAVGAGLYVLRVRRTGEAGRDDDSLAVVAAAHDFIERGLSAPRVLLEITRRYPEEASALASLDPSVFRDERFPLFRTRPGRRRLEDLLALLARPAGDEGLLAGDLADLLSEAVRGKVPPEQVASAITARVPEDHWASFSRMNLGELAAALRASGTQHPALITPRARGVALQVQAALRSEHRHAGGGVTVGWLVCADGNGTRGQTLRLPAGRALVGRAPTCEVRFPEDSQLAEQHAVITVEAGRFHIEPLQGNVKVETRAARGPTSLHDGDTIEIGGGRYVFKCVSSGEVTAGR